MKQVTIKLDDALWSLISHKTNTSRYIKELIKQDVQLQQAKPIVEAVVIELLKHELFIAELSARVLKGKALGMTNTSVTSMTQSTPFVPRPPDPSTGYPCCTKDMLCKHWQWDETAGQRINTLTGAVRTSE